MATDEQETTPAAVKTYIPEYQRDIWDDHADELGMSRSEFIRSMVQAGRRGFDPRGEASETGSDGDTAEPTDMTASAKLAERVTNELANGALSWDELLEAVTDDVEAQLEETLQDLQEKNRVQYSGRDGGYVLVE